MRVVLPLPHANKTDEAPVDPPVEVLNASQSASSSHSSSSIATNNWGPEPEERVVFPSASSSSSADTKRGPGKVAESACVSVSGSFGSRVFEVPNVAKGSEAGNDTDLREDDNTCAPKETSSARTSTGGESSLLINTRKRRNGFIELSENTPQAAEVNRTFNSSKRSKQAFGNNCTDDSSHLKPSAPHISRKTNPLSRKKSTARMGRSHRSNGNGEECEPRFVTQSSHSTEVRENSYHSEDRLRRETDPAMSNSEQASFHELLKDRGLEVVEQDGDGNCLFRAVSLQVYGDASMHGEVRQRCLDFMTKDEEHFSQFVTGENFYDYIQRKRRDGVHGNHTELQAISELFNRPVEVFVPSHGASPINIFHGDYKTEELPIRLSYHDGNHYNAVVDPLCPTAGLGLGLPGLDPGLADRLQVEKAVKESDQLQIEKIAEDSHRKEVEKVMKDSRNSMDQMMKEKALLMSDLEATDFELEQMALARSLEALTRDQYGRKTSRHNTQHEPENLGNSLKLQSNLKKSSDKVSSAASADPNMPAARMALGHNSGNNAPTGAIGDEDEYPKVVQELVVNGFELGAVLRAYDLIGDSFGDLFSFLMNSS